MRNKKEKPTIGYIYALIDPITLQVRYVGQTIGPIHIRRNAHVRGAIVKKFNFYKDRWIRKRNGKIYVKLVETLPIEQLDVAEIKWIKYYRDRGYPITNATKGGGGTRGHKWSDASRKKLSLAKTGVPLSPAHIAASALGRTGIPRTQRAKDNLSIAIKNWHKTHVHQMQGTHKTEQEKKHQSIKVNVWYETHDNPRKGTHDTEIEKMNKSRGMLKWLETHEPNQLGVKQRKETRIKRGLAIKKTLALKRMIKYQMSEPEGVKFNPKQAVLHNLSPKQLAVLAS